MYFTRVVRFYNTRGTFEQWIKEGKYALNGTRLFCHDFVDNQVRLQLFTRAYNLASSKKFVGEFWFGQVVKVMIQNHFQRFKLMNTIDFRVVSFALVFKPPQSRRKILSGFETSSKSGPDDSAASELPFSSARTENAIPAGTTEPVPEGSRWLSIWEISD